MKRAALPLVAVLALGLADGVPARAQSDMLDYDPFAETWNGRAP